MNTPMGFIGAMLEPCETKGQAVLTSFCMLVVATGAVAIGYALFLFGEGARETIAELDLGASGLRGQRAEGNMYMYMFLGYAGAVILGLITLVMLLCAIIAPIRTLFPKELKKREQVLR